MAIKTDETMSSHRIWVPDVLWQELAVEAVRTKRDTSGLLTKILAERYPEVAAEHEVDVERVPRSRPGAAVAARAAREMAREGQGSQGA